MPSLKLTYFDGRGRGEPIIWILSAAKLPFEHETFGFEEWPTRKPTTPYGSVPILYVDGTPICQTVAISRYVGTRGGLVASDPVHAARADEAVDTTAEIMNKLFDNMFIEDAEKKAASEKKFWDDYLPNILKLWESRVKTDFFICDKATWADVFISYCLSRLQEARPDALKAYPQLTKALKNVLELEGLKAYLANPPKYSLPF